MALIPLLFLLMAPSHAEPNVEPTQSLRGMVFTNIEKFGRHQFWVQGVDHCGAMPNIEQSASQPRSAGDFIAIEQIPDAWNALTNISIEDTDRSLIVRIDGRDEHCMGLPPPNILATPLPAGAYAGPGALAALIHSADANAVVNGALNVRNEAFSVTTGTTLLEALTSPASRRTYSFIIAEFKSGIFVNIRADFPPIRPLPNTTNMSVREYEEYAVERELGWRALCESDPSQCAAADDPW